MKRPATLVKTTFRIFSNRSARFLGAAVAFYALLSGAPLLLVVLRIVGAVFGASRAESALWSGLLTWLGPSGVATIRTITERLEAREASGSVFGVLVVIYGSTRLFRALRKAVNELWGIDLETIEAKRSRVKRYAVRYGIALVLIAFAAAIVSALVVVKAAFALVGALGLLAEPLLLWGLDVALSVTLAFVLFTVLFRVLPETDVTWREAATSGAVSTVLFSLGSIAVSLYLKQKNVPDLYAGASAVVLALLWSYYSAQVFLLGACFAAARREARNA